MTCFWDGILKGLIVHRIIETNSNYQNFIDYLKKKCNCVDQNIKVNGMNITHNQKLENIQHIKNLDILKLYQGYYCSTFDPVLIFICSIFLVNIVHKYNNIDIIYECENCIDTLHFCSNSGHFWFVK